MHTIVEQENARMKHTGWALLELLLFGAVLGTGLDTLHVASNVERYPRPAFLGVAWWVPFLFSGAAVAIGYSHASVDPFLHQRRIPHSFWVSMSGVAWFVLAYLVSASILNSGTKLGLLVLIYLHFWFLGGKGWQNILLSLLTAITGTLIEMILVAVGAFRYIHPDLLGIPYWLPCLYACASLAVGDLGRFFLLSATRRHYEPL